MCGLVGAFSFSRCPPDELDEPIRRLIPRMARRGPDDEGFWSDGERCALGFRRLSILDLGPTGHQPMSSEDGRFTLVVNGEIYNFRSLRSELTGLGWRFRSTGDSETLLAALSTWGPAALERLNGMFALALYDARERRLLLARDHAGIKPLHYAVTPRGVVFASQYDQVIHHPWSAGTRPSADGLALYLRFGFVPAPFGLHEGAAQVECGSCVQADDGGRVTTHRFFAFPKMRRASLRGHEADAAFDEAFGAAVRRHLESDVPVGVFLSGGVDSPLVAAEARKHVRGELLAFTIGIDDPSMDESPDAARFAQELGLRHVVERVTPAQALEIVPDIVAACTEPTADYGIIPTLLVSRLAARHVKVVLSGDGGDELFWGYPRRYGRILSRAALFGLPLPLRLSWLAASRLLHSGSAGRGPLERTIGDLYRNSHTILAEETIRSTFVDPPRLPASFDAFRFDGHRPDEVAQWARWNEFELHLARVLAKVDRASMYHSIEVRVPLLDRDVVDLATRTDWRSCIDPRRKVGKLVLRQALGRRVRHATPGKRGFGVPIGAWLAGPLRHLVEEALVDRPSLLGYELRPGAIRAVVERITRGDQSDAWGLWSLTALALWCTHHDR